MAWGGENTKFVCINFGHVIKFFLLSPINHKRSSLRPSALSFVHYLGELKNFMHFRELRGIDLRRFTGA